MSETSSGGDGGGCLIIVILLFLTCCGVTVDGRHYGVGCSCGDGCTFTQEAP